MRAVTRVGRHRSSCCCRGPTWTSWASGSPRSTDAPRSPTTWPPPRPRPSRCGLELEHHQTNHEGELVELVHGARGRAAALIVNAGALTHYSWSLHDALAAFDGIVVELHLSNPAAREPWRHTSVVAAVADGAIAGFGGLGYPLAVQAVARLLAQRRRARAAGPTAGRGRRRPGRRPGAAAGRRPPGAGSAAGIDARGRGRAARHRARQRPLPHRVQRLGRRPARDPDAAPCS